MYIQAGALVHVYVKKSAEEEAARINFCYFLFLSYPSLKALKSKSVYGLFSLGDKVCLILWRNKKRFMHPPSFWYSHLRVADFSQKIYFDPPETLFLLHILDKIIEVDPPSPSGIGPKNSDSFYGRSS
jgi:hypothetical protein